MQYTFYFKRRGSDTLETATETGRLISDALQKWCKRCIEEDDTGIFFELDNADIGELKKNRHFHTVHIVEGLYGIVLEDLDIFEQNRNTYLLKLRARRELLGLTTEEMVELTGMGQYKEQENNRRKCYLDDYVRFMNVLDAYETGEI